MTYRLEKPTGDCYFSPTIPGRECRCLFHPKLKKKTKKWSWIYKMVIELKGARDVLCGLTQRSHRQRNETARENLCNRT